MAVTKRLLSPMITLGVVGGKDARNERDV